MHWSRVNGASDPTIWNRLIRFGFRLLYHEMAWSYDVVAWLVSFGQWQRWGQTTLPHLTGWRVLELGHGPGHLLIALAEHGYFPVGLDPSPQMARLAHRRIHQAGFAAPLVCGRAQELPFHAHEFDSVVATFPTAYIAELVSLKEVARVLKPEGRLVVVLGAQLGGRDPISRFVEWLYAITGQRETMDAEEWVSKFATAGMKMRRITIEVDESQVWLLVAQPANLHDRGG